MTPTFTADYFSRNIPSWQHHLAKFKDVPCNAVELGSLEGRSACWLIDNILTHEESGITCIENNVKEVLEENLQPYGYKVSLIESDATTFLRTYAEPLYDLAYIDADHVVKDVILQAGLLHPMMKKGGIMIFDDYGHMDWGVKPAVDFFLLHWPDLQVVKLGNQAIIERL